MYAVRACKSVTECHLAAGLSPDPLQSAPRSPICESKGGNKRMQGKREVGKGKKGRSLREGKKG